MNNHSAPTGLISPYRGALVRPMADPQRVRELKAASLRWPSWDLTHRQLCDLELLLSGAFSPLGGFMNRDDYEGVLDPGMRLADGTLWPTPITLDVSEYAAGGLRRDDPLCLRDPEGVLLAVLHVEQVWQPDLPREARCLCGTTRDEHPAVRQLLHGTNPWYVGGRLEGVCGPSHFDFQRLRHTPRQVRQELAKRGWRRVMAFSPGDAIHRVQVSLISRAAREHQASVLLHPVVGMTRPGDVDHYTRIRCYQAVLPRLSPPDTMLSLLNYFSRPAGPREALLHAIVARNHGCTHLLLEPHEPGAAEVSLQQHSQELGVEPVAAPELVYVHDRDQFCPEEEVPAGLRTSQLCGISVRADLARGEPPPPWYSYPEVMEQLRQTCPPRHEQGFSVFFTGLSGAGKSTLARVLLVRLLEQGGRPVTLLDGDIARRHLSSELTFSREHRDLNIRRIGFVASEITKNRGIAICAPIAPFDRVRQEVRQMVSEVGGFIMIHVATPLSTCEARDRKGMYAKARAGLIKGFTGVDDPYEAPEQAQMVIDTTDATPRQCVRRILRYLREEGYLGGEVPFS